MTPTKLVMVGLGIAAIGIAYLTRSDPAYALPLAATGGQLLGLIFPEIGKKKIEVTPE